jgi:hypothetical protein
MTIGPATAVEFVVMASKTSSVHQLLAHGFVSIAPATLRRFDSIASEAQSSIINKSPDIKIPQDFADIDGLPERPTSTTMKRSLGNFNFGDIFIGVSFCKLVSNTSRFFQTFFWG